MADARTDLVELERRGWEALSGSTGADFYGEIMAEDGLMVFPGMILDKRGALAAIRAAPPWSSFELHDLRVVTEGDFGGVVYRARAERNGEPPYEALMSSVYVVRRGRWLLVLHQQSP